MKRAVSFVLIAFASVLLVIANPSFGAPVTFQVTGVIDEVRYNGAGIGNLFPIAAGVGSPFTYLVTYDPTLATNYASGTGFSRYSGAITRTSVSFGSQTFVFPSLITNNIDVIGGPTVASSMTIGSASSSPICGGHGAQTFSASLSLDGGPVGYFADTSIPTFALDFSVFPQAIHAFAFGANLSSPGTGCLDASDLVAGHITNIPQPSTPIVGLSSTYRDFGIVNIGSTRDLAVTVTNNGAALLQGIATVSPPYSISSSPALFLLPGQSVDLVVRISPLAGGRFDQTASLQFLGASTSTTFQLVGYGLPSTTLAPKLSKVPPSAAVGSTAIIEGRNFDYSQGASTMTLNGIPVTILSWYDKLIRFAVPQTQAGIGDLQIKTSHGSVGTSLTVLASAPVINKLGDASVSAGSTLVVWGQNFGAQQANSAITIAGTPVPALQWADQFITAKVPSVKNGSYAVEVTTNSGRAMSSLRVRNVVAIVNYDPCAIGVDFSAFFGKKLSPVCPPLVVSPANGSLVGTVNLSLENVAARWYKLTATPIGAVLPVPAPYVVAPKTIYSILGIALAKDQAVVFSVDSNADLAVAMTSLDYLTQWLQALGLQVPSVPRDARDLASLVADLLANSAPFTSVVVKYGSCKFSDFVCAYDANQALFEFLATDPKAAVLAGTLGVTGLRDAAAGVAEFTRYVKAVNLAAEAFEAGLTAPVFGSTTVVGK